MGNLVRLDSTNGSGYWQVTEDGLFQFGHSKGHRLTLPQFKVMLATLDPLGLAVGLQVVSGDKADDSLVAGVTHSSWKRSKATAGKKPNGPSAQSSKPNLN